MLVDLLSLFVQFIENLVLLLNQEGSFNMVLSLLLVLEALGLVLRGWDNLWKILLRYKLLKRYLFYWAVHSSLRTRWTNARWWLSQSLKRYCFFSAIILMVSRRKPSRRALKIIWVAVTRHEGVDVDIDVGEVLLSLSKHFQWMLFNEGLLRTVLNEIVFLLISVLIQRTFLFLHWVKFDHMFDGEPLAVTWWSLALPRHHFSLVKLSHSFFIIYLLQHVGIFVQLLDISEMKCFLWKIAWVLLKICWTCFFSSAALVRPLEFVQWANCKDTNVFGRTHFDIVNTWPRSVVAAVLVLDFILVHVFCILIN